MTRRAPKRIVCASLALAGCASKLDFDAVSAGPEIERTTTDGGRRPPMLDAAMDEQETEELDAGAPIRVARRDAETWTLPPVEQVEVDAARPVLRAPSLDCSALTPVPYFCDDFSLPDLTTRWSYGGVEPEDAGALEIERAEPGVSWLRTEIHADVMNTCRNCIRSRVELQLPELLAPTRIVIDLDLMLPKSDPAPGRRVALLLLAFDDQTEETLSLQTLELISTGSGVDALYTESLPEDDTTLQESGRFPVALRDRWMHLHYELEAADVTAQGAPFSVRLDDTLLASGKLGYALGGALPYLALGLPWLDSTQLDAQTLNGGWSALYDNVVIRAEAL